MDNSRKWKAAALGLLLGTLLGWIPVVLVILPLTLFAVIVAMLTGSAIGFWITLALAVLGWIGVVVLATSASMAETASKYRSLACQRCGYNLLGSRSGACPECGRTIDRRQRAFLLTQEPLLTAASRPDDVD